MREREMRPRREVPHMPRTAAAVSRRHDDEATITQLDELIQRGRGQGHLSLPELRAAFEQARMSPTEARSIIRELTEAGVQRGNEAADTAGRSTRRASRSRASSDSPANVTQAAELAEA